MIRTLIAKEFREHWLPFSAVAAISLLGLFIIALAAIVTGEAGNELEALRGFLIFFGVLDALVLCNRLVVREYQGKTQLFLESLPLTRGRMIVVKYALGFSILLGLVAATFVVLLPMVARRQSLTLLFIEIVAVRAFAFVFFVYSFFFVTGMLGRYRMAIYVGIALGFFLLSITTNMEPGRFGPFAIVDRTFPFERDHFPMEALALTLGLGTAFSVMAFTLALVREGSAASMLAEKMSHREKLFVTAVVLGILFIGDMFDKKHQKQPFDLPGAIVENSGGTKVEISVRLEDHSAGEALARRVHAELAAVGEYLDLAHSPPVFITTRRDLDANRYELGELVNGEGLLVRVNFAAAGFDEDRFLMWLVREFLINATNGRVKLESKMWVLDGFGPFWVRGHHGAASLADDRQLALRAVYGTTESGLSEADLRNWLSYRERVGDGVAAGVAWSGLEVLARRQGPDRCREFLRAVLASRVPANARALWFERRNSIEAQFEHHAGTTMREFLTGWREELRSARLTLAADLARLPHLRGDLWFEPLSPDTRIGRYRVAVDPPANTDGARLTLLHADLPVFDTEVAPHVLQREDIDPERKAAGELPGTWTRGERFYSTFSLSVAELGCDVISGWSRREIQ